MQKKQKKNKKKKQSKSTEVLEPNYKIWYMYLQTKMVSSTLYIEVQVLL